MILDYLKQEWETIPLDEVATLSPILIESTGSVDICSMKIVWTPTMQDWEEKV